MTDAPPLDGLVLAAEDLRLIAHERAGEVIKLRAETKRLRAALNKALALCRYCDGTSTVVRTDAETGEMIGAENCEKCWPLRSDSAHLEKS